MNKIFLSAMLLGIFLFSCKEDEKTYCYECATSATINDGTGEVEMPNMSITTEQCGLTEEQAKTASATTTTTSGGTTMKTTTVCNKK